jgi:hypothetical protein
MIRRPTRENRKLPVKAERVFILAFSFATLLIV